MSCGAAWWVVTDEGLNCVVFIIDGENVLWSRLCGWRERG